MNTKLLLATACILCSGHVVDASPLTTCMTGAQTLPKLFSQASGFVTPASTFRIEPDTATAESFDTATGNVTCSVGWSMTTAQLKASEQSKLTEISIFPGGDPAAKDNDKMEDLSEKLVQIVNASHPRALYMVKPSADGGAMITLLRQSTN